MERADVVIASDVVYDPSVVPQLVQQLAHMLAHGAVALVASVVRNASTLDAFVCACESAGLTVTEHHRGPLESRAAHRNQPCYSDVAWVACAALETSDTVVLHAIAAQAGTE